ncbi:secondary thiamine-phosphate synthase enzyme YjbQ [Pseudoalteromonas sp. MM17-2]|uniref:secondary thiamine-phosphate synthase enzyme YjbQ n=1 Tax=unclassified Pseudoalteromonas TaxID=194690 RepID=UPI001023AC06|nr:MULTISPECIES: secondary thiamine-phosphate synthase enzyme YjbQ [unclassified Pseudoalteromonas]MCG7543275.1 secondary thiamine-phosphate synthase enzyme YjbQ [Pseudoalteromonas sp. MM17-2]RZF87910.1 YjbQ family protein [Pseudoalteromonas sp. CO325X]
MSWQQHSITLSAKRRGFHLIDEEILRALPQIQDYQVGLLHLMLQHTSASLSINENADPTVRQDMEAHFNWAAPERQPFYRHTYEGDDDMPAHIKASTLGCELTLPISHGQLQLGTWQGIYLGEHRDQGGSRRIVATLQGQLMASK